MKLSSLLYLLLLGLTTTGQTTDSIHYKYGYLYYHVYGSGETIILLSGGPGNDCHQLEDMAFKLSKRNRVILLEQRGTGLSMPSPLDSTTINLQASFDDINLLLEHLRLKEAILCGHSYGGSLAMLFTSKYPQHVKSLILVAPGFFALGKEMYFMVDNLRSHLGIEELRRMDTLDAKSSRDSLTPDEQTELSKLRRLGYIYDKKKIDSLYPKINARRNLSMASTINKELAKLNFDLGELSANFKKPIHIICGRQDLVTYVSYELKIKNPVASLNWIDRCGHFPMYEQPQIFYSILDNILKGIK